ncbi:lysophospholipid acyltransferase family protein [Acidiferrobacter sp.]|uniref:lysophospholipid acyltransferase family protein n=1 Tax=Acidiferrobacter sp. TaxID=1872107 RepID=UPI00261BB78F|nr:lysophospholipid acyltransferase family protein [Acidiferrobacter sp.]
MSERAGSLGQASARVALVVFWALSHLPLPVLAALGHALGRLAHRLLAARRRVVLTNLRLCFPEHGEVWRKRLARAHFASLGQGVFDVMVAWWASPARLARLVSFRGREHYDRALAQGPVILLVPHFAAIEIGCVLSTERPMANVYRRLPNPVFEAAFRRGIGRFGATMITQEEGVRPIMKALREGRVLYYLPDQDFGERSSVFAPFFGVPTITLHAIGRLARTVAAQVVPCYVWQKPRGRGYEIAFGPPLEGFPSNDALIDATATNRAIEAGVREHPEQYFWVHKRFKTRPPGAPSVY